MRGIFLGRLLYNASWVRIYNIYKFIYLSIYLYVLGSISLDQSFCAENLHNNSLKYFTCYKL